MAVCIETAKRYNLDDYRTPVFIFERLCSIIYPVSGGASHTQLSARLREPFPCEPLGDTLRSSVFTTCGPFSYHFIFLRFYLFIFGERGKEGEREGNINVREKHRPVAS